MNDISIIDRFLDVFSRYIDSGFGLLHGEVAFLTATLIVIDMTLAGLFWAMSHATGQGEDVIAKLIRKVLYVGAFAYIIGNFNWLAGIVFRSFAGLGLTASGSTLSMGNFLQPGRLAKAGIDAAAPILDQIKEATNHCVHPGAGSMVKYVVYFTVTKVLPLVVAICEGDHTQHLCELAGSQRFDMIRELAKAPEFMCANCGRLADQAKNLCNPMPVTDIPMDGVS